MHTMKTMSCDICDTQFQGETFDDWFKACQQHYMADHADFMAAAAGKPKEEGLKWMEEARKRFEAV